MPYSLTKSGGESIQTFTCEAELTTPEGKRRVGASGAFSTTRTGDCWRRSSSSTERPRSPARSASPPMPIRRQRRRGRLRLWRYALIGGLPVDSRLAEYSRGVPHRLLYNAAQGHGSTVSRCNNGDPR